ncbi:MAG TPA: hypothetical protein VGM18_12640 [Candidatus Sulfotelmatobacter sp.]
MDAILISWRPDPKEVEDVLEHLADGHEYYWRVKFRFAKKNDFKFPMLGYVHMAGRNVEHLLSICDIIPFSTSHYELSDPVIPESWIKEWNDKPNERVAWKTQLVVTKIEPIRYNTLSFQKCDGTPVKQPPMNFIRVLEPSGPMALSR